MTYLVAAAGTGGHVYPGLSVGEALLELGVAQEDITYVGGDRLESQVYPAEGFRFVEVELAGLKRSLTMENVRIPQVVMRARNQVADEIDELGVDVVLGMGGYVTIPVGMAARRNRVVFFNAEQNAEAGLANRVAARWARATFVSFPDTRGLPGGHWVGNPVRRPFWEFDRLQLRAEAIARYELDDSVPVVGVFGGSLGAGVINEAVADMIANWDGPDVQVVHLTGETHLEAMSDRDGSLQVTWRRLGFEDRMDLFYAASDLVVGRAGGAVAELTATATPSILVPGAFGSGSHQADNAAALARAGAAAIVAQDQIAGLRTHVADLVTDSGARLRMARAAQDIARPGAALTIAKTMIEAVT